MTAIWNSGRGDDPSTHVLVVGIGAYAKQIPDSDIPKAEPLSTNARSALAFLDWVFEAGQSGHFAPPLGSVYAAVSDPRLTPAPVSVETPVGNKELPQPTISELTGIIGGWLDDLDRNENNMALAYFCGHGIANRTSFLLSEDYGSNKRNAYTGLIDIDGFEIVVRTTKASTQLILVDCCQEFQPDLFDQLLSVNGETFGSVGRGDLSLPRRALVKSAEPGVFARADRDRLTYFCDAFLYAVRGAAADADENGNWSVSFSSLEAGIREAAKRRSKTEIEPEWQIKYLSPPNLVQLPGPPDVEVVLQTDPPPALAESIVSVQHHSMQESKELQYPMGFAVTLTLPAQMGYTASAHFEDGYYKDIQHFGFTAEPFGNPVILPTPRANVEDP